MIYYFHAARNGVPIWHYLRATWPGGVGAHIRRVAYEDLAGFKPGPGLYIFTDIELIDDVQRAAAAALRERLLADPRRHIVWNDPARSARRFDVLAAMSAEGRNTFRAFRLDGTPLPADLRYPVFVRDEHDHTGALTGRLSGESELRAAVAELRAGRRPAGPLLVVEYLDYGRADGVFRKYSVFRLGARMIRKHIIFSRDWQAKAPARGEFDKPEWRAEEWAFLRGEADEIDHEKETMGIFERFAIDYGRIDYAVVGGRAQVFEINSNPTLMRSENFSPRTPRTEVHEWFRERFEAVLLETGAPGAPSFARRLRWRLDKPKLEPKPLWRRLWPAALGGPGEMVLHGRETRRVGGCVEVSARLEGCGRVRRVALSAPEWASPWLDESYDALLLASLPWAETEGWNVRVRGPVSARLLEGLRRRAATRRARGEDVRPIGVRADETVETAPAIREGAVLHYTGDVFSQASAVELSAEDGLHPRPSLAVGGEDLPGEEDGKTFLEKLGLRYVCVKVERPDPVLTKGGDLDGAARLRFLGKGFGTGYLPATAAYRHAEPDPGEPDADLDPLFSGGGMRIVHHGAHRTLAATLAALRGANAPEPEATRTDVRAPAGLVEAGLALMRGGSPDGWREFDLKKPRARLHALDFLRWLRGEPELAATVAGRALGARLRAALGLPEEGDLPKAEARISPLAAAPDIGRGRMKRPFWADGLAWISDDRRVVNRDLIPIASWMRLRDPRMKADAERTLTLTQVLKKRRTAKPRMMFDLHPTPAWATGIAPIRCGVDLTKSEELAVLAKAGVSVPRWKLLQPGDRLGDEELGRYVVVKPDHGLRGAQVRVQKASGVRGDPIFVESLDKSSAPLAQEFIYTGPRPVSHRVGVLFGKAIYRWRVEGRAVDGRSLPEDGDFRASSGASVVSTGKDCEFRDPFDAEVVAFAEKAARALPHVPLMGVDVARRLPDGKLFVLELNSCGYCFHLTSERGQKMQATTWLELPEQYGGYAYIADLARLAWERENGW